MKYKKSLLTIFLIACVLFSISSVMASDANETAMAIEDDNQMIEQTISASNEEEILTADEGTFTALQKKINDAPEGSTITLENDYTYDDGFDTDGIRISKTITIDGNGHTINGLSKSRIFYFNSGERSDHYATLKNITFSNGLAEYGGAIYTTTLSGSDGFTVYYWHLTVDNCVFKGNTASEEGGAIFSNSITISNSLFNANSAGVAGAINLGTCHDCVFTNNRASGYGGAASGGIFNKCNFIGNSANEGGAICGACDINSCTFDSNNANEGGAIKVYMTDCMIQNSKFTNNRASKGGAAYMFSYSYSHMYGESSEYVNYYDQTIQNCVFIGNVASQKAGAIYAPVLNGRSTKITGCTFSKNSAPSNDDVLGGVISNCAFDKKPSSGSSKATPKLTAKKATFKVKAKTKKYSVVLKTNKNKAMKNVKLYLKVNGKTYTAKTNSKGKATFKITNLKKKGTFKATITYKGNTNYNKVTKTVKIKCR